jgi:hypothetical protein
MATQTGNPNMLKRKFGLASINSETDIERIKGLAIQPFIFALTACQGDLEAHLRHNQFRANTHYDRDLAATKSFDRALFNAGYSIRGNPYWVDQTKGEPTIDQIEAITTAAGRCLLPLSDRHQTLVRGQDTKGAQALGERMHNFENALEELGGMVGMVRAAEFMRDFANSRPKVVTGPGYMCALE